MLDNENKHSLFDTFVMLLPTAVILLPIMGWMLFGLTKGAPIGRTLFCIALALGGVGFGLYMLLATKKFGDREDPNLQG